MRTVYINCESGVSGDMVLNALADLTEDPASVRANIERVREIIEEKGAGAHSHGHEHSHDHGHHHDHGQEHSHEHGHHNDHEHLHNHGHDHDHTHEHSHDHGHHYDHEHLHNHGHDHDHTHEHSHSDEHHRSYQEVKGIIDAVPVSSRVKSIANQIYAVIGKAESAVHGEPLETLHFHEVGRNQAIANAMGVAICLDALRPDQVIVSEIYDGHGTVKCAHGVLNVPVPAVKAMLDACDLAYKQTDYEGEMVTPSGLAMVLGIGAMTGERPEGTLVRAAEAKGARSFTDHGLIAELYD